MKVDRRSRHPKTQNVRKCLAQFKKRNITGDPVRRFKNEENFYDDNSEKFD